MTRSTTGSDAEGAPAATARALAPEDHGESSSGSSSKPPVIVVPYSIGDYHLLEQSVEGFSVPFLPFFSEADDEPPTCAVRAGNIADALGGSDFENALIDAAPSIDGVDVLAVLNRTAKGPSLAPPPSPTGFECTMAEDGGPALPFTKAIALPGVATVAR